MANGQEARVYGQQQSPLVTLPQYQELVYFYVYVAESEYSDTGYWIPLEPDKTLSLKSLRSYYATCFGIKFKFVNAKNEMETKYVRYQNGFYRFPAGIDMNNTRFIAYYYSDVDDVKAFMTLTEANNETATVPALEFKTCNLDSNESTLGRTAINFDMENVLKRGAQSTPKNYGRTMPTLENVSSTSDVIVNEPTVEYITVPDSSSIAQKPPPPPPGPPRSQSHIKKNPPITLGHVGSNIGTKFKSGPNVSSTSDVENESNEKLNKNKHEPITIHETREFKKERSSVTVKPVATSRSKNMLNRYQLTRPKPLNVDQKTPLKITLKSRGRHIQRNKKIMKIEDEKGRTTALLTKKNWGGCAKRRLGPIDESEVKRYDKRYRYDALQNQYYHQAESNVLPFYDDYYRTMNVLLVGFHTIAPVIHETKAYFSEFGIVTDIQLFTTSNRRDPPEHYAFMKIQTDDAVTLFSDRHLYNGTVIYAIRVDGTRLPSRLHCGVCGYQGLNVGYLNYHLEGQYHQSLLQKQLNSHGGTIGKVYRQSYYRISNDKFYVQHPDLGQDTVGNEYWRRSENPSIFASANHRYNMERGRNY